VNKFCGCVSNIEDRRQSGVTFQDKVIFVFDFCTGLIMHGNFY
jgi:hypothetical protein